ncbi:hypothetical protein O7626_25275 [Micromonospora sp. WMMD1102]|uniref:hypothetical protein n=1 Tax=Micromonospora sp. WMMD1102 TaxID=3016105 RepID=UPI0024156AC4|nr:hypothetical protein [Micromonospora sp. WMMD1102]MDG4789202.1 hypothetical protein [Micromonospora sp. WMMD1102]
MSTVDRAIAVAAGATVVVLAGVAGAISCSHMAELAWLGRARTWATVDAILQALCTLADRSPDEERWPEDNWSELALDA